MSKTVTLRISDEEYELYVKAAEAVKRPISNMINYLAHTQLEESLFVDQIEADEILNDAALVKSLKKGSEDAEQMKGVFVDV